ncbi:MAG: ROK family protein, partial [Bacteriovoracaceae bacterium]|nr:ROK family protein [Bacteriovoracaceae bacterium]
LENLGVQMHKIAIGIDIGGTNTKIGAVNHQGSLLGFKSFPTKDPQDFQSFSLKTKQVCDLLLSELGLSMDNVLGIGVGAPNGSSIEGKIINPPNLKNWGTVELVGPFKALFNVPVYLDNDANVAALGEGKWGRAKDLNDFIVITLGTGIGTGIVINNKLVRGESGLAGEGGHISIDFSGRQCGCGGKGHLEMYGSVKGIKTTVYELLGKEMSFAEISDGYRNNDKEMLEVFKTTADYLGRGLATMGSLLAPQSFILAGGVATIGEKFCEDVQTSLNEYIFPTFKNKVLVQLSEISTGEGAVLGAAALVL